MVPLSSHPQDGGLSDVERQPLPKHHATIFRASFFTGGAQLAAAVVSLLRNKLAAITLGVLGVGIGGLLLQASNLAQAFLGLGIGYSGVRSIAAAHGRGDVVAMARAYKALRIWTWFTGIAASLLCSVLSTQLSQLSFGNADHETDFKLIGVAALFQQISQGQAALLRGMGRIKELAMLNIAASFLGLVAAVPCYVYLGIKGLAPALVLAMAANLLASWWQARHIKLPEVEMSRAEILAEGRELVRLGMAFVGVAAAGMSATYIIGCLIRANVGAEGNGYFQAASGISIVLAGYVLSAMGQDYYPRLITLIHKPEQASKLMEDQTEMALLMSAPLLVAASAFAPLLLSIAYSGQFAAASAMVTWLALGCLGRVVSWPLGFALLAEGKPALVLAYEGAFAVISVGLAWLGLRLGGLMGAAASFSLLYLIYWAVMSLLIRSRIGFRPSRRLVLTFVILASAIFSAQWLEIWLGLAFTMAVAAYCVSRVIGHLGPDHRLSIAISKAGPLARALGVVAKPIPAKD